MKTLDEVNQELIKRTLENISLFCNNPKNYELFILDPEPMTVDDLKILPKEEIK